MKNPIQYNTKQDKTKQNKTKYLSREIASSNSKDEDEEHSPPDGRSGSGSAYCERRAVFEAVRLAELAGNGACRLIDGVIQVREFRTVKFIEKLRWLE